MKPMAFFAIPLALVSHAAFAGSVGGNGALALAALAGEHSQSVKALDRIELLRLINGQLNGPFPANKKIAVKVDAVSCKTSNVDISEHSCELTFGSRKFTIKGRRAHELYATLAEVGVPPDGAAGSTFEALADLDCTVDPGEIKQKTGGGAQCSFNPAK